MIYYNNTHVKAGDESRRAIEARQEREARERITEEFVALLSLDPDEGARWTGTVTDLMEATHIAYTQGTICDSEGNTCTFTQLVTGICDTLHVAAAQSGRMRISGRTAEGSAEELIDIQIYAANVSLGRGKTAFK